MAVSIYIAPIAMLIRKMDFDLQRLIKRWTMGEGVETFLTYEEGAYSKVIIAKTFDILLNTFVKLLLVLFNAIIQMAIYFDQPIKALYSKSLDTISKLPKCFIADGLMFAVSIVLIALFSKKIRYGIITHFNELWKTFETNIRKFTHFAIV